MVWVLVGDARRMSFHLGSLGMLGLVMNTTDPRRADSRPSFVLDKDVFQPEFKELTFSGVTVSTFKRNHRLLGGIWKSALL